MSRHKITDERWHVREIKKRGKFKNTEDLRKKMKSIIMHFHRATAISEMVEKGGRHGYIIYDLYDDFYRAIEIEIIMI